MYMLNSLHLIEFISRFGSVDDALIIDVLSSSWDGRMMSDYKVDTINDDLQMFYVTFHGPTDSNPLCLFCLVD